MLSNVRNVGTMLLASYAWLTDWVKRQAVFDDEAPDKTLGDSALQRLNIEVAKAPMPERHVEWRARRRREGEGTDSLGRNPDSRHARPRRLFPIAP